MLWINMYLILQGEYGNPQNYIIPEEDNVLAPTTRTSKFQFNQSYHEMCFAHFWTINLNMNKLWEMFFTSEHFFLSMGNVFYRKPNSFFRDEINQNHHHTQKNITILNEYKN